MFVTADGVMGRKARIQMRPFKVTLVEAGETANLVPVWVRKTLAAEDIEFSVHGCEILADLAAYASDSDLVWVWGSRILTACRLEILARCGAILRSGSGTDNVPVAEATERNVLVINTPGALAQEVSDHTIALLLSAMRQIVVQDRLMRSGVWDRRIENNRWHLRGSTLGLIGFGHIAQLVAEKVGPFGLRILVHDPWVPKDQIRMRGAEPVDLRTLLSQADFISVHCPLTTATHYLIGEREIQLMKRHAILINTSRGPIVNESALARALQEKRIGGAALDVFEREPLPTESPLLQLENVVLTPHIASYSDEYPESFWRYSVESVIAIANGYWPRAVVNPSVQPRWPLLRREWPIYPETYEISQDGDGPKARSIDE
jgi:D-3-phosphoglycerate dehydrogenase / 2-oxoglutarate reductase